MKLSNLIAVLCVVGLAQYGCGGAQTGVSPKSSLAAEFDGAPSWVKTKKCPKSEPSNMICGVSADKAESATDLDFATATASAKARAEIAKKLSVKSGTILKTFGDKYRKEVGGQRAVEMSGKISRAVSEIAKMQLSGAGVVDTWISSSNNVYVAVSLDAKSAIAAMKQNSAVSAELKKEIDKKSDDLHKELSDN